VERLARDRAVHRSLRKPHSQTPSFLVSRSPPSHRFFDPTLLVCHLHSTKWLRWCEKRPPPSNPELARKERPDRGGCCGNRITRFCIDGSENAAGDREQGWQGSSRKWHGSRVVEGASPPGGPKRRSGSGASLVAIRQSQEERPKVGSGPPQVMHSLAERCQISRGGATMTEHDPSNACRFWLEVPRVCRFAPAAHGVWFLHPCQWRELP
jgi:hypothetical protein